MLLSVINECEAVMNLYTKSKGDTVHHRSVAKRYELLAACVKRISTELAAINNSNLDATFNSTGINAFTSRIKFPDSVRNLPLDVSGDSTSDFSGTGPDWLKRKYLSHVQKKNYEKNTRKHCDESFESLKLDLYKTYISRVSERKSFLYRKTPRKTQNDVGEETKCAFQTNSHYLSWSETQLTCSLEITEVLENLTSLPDTLTSLKLSDGSNITVIKNRTSNYKQEQEDSSEDTSANNETNETSCVSKLSENRNVLSLVSVRTDEVSDVTTPDRLYDINAIKNKIHDLKMTIYGETEI